MWTALWTRQKSARPDLDTTIAGRAAGASDQVAPARLALREQPAECGRARETGVEDAVVDEGIWVGVFARRYQQRQKTVHTGRPVRPLDWIIGRCSGCPGVASRKNSSLQRMQRKRKVSVARVDQ